MSEWMGIERRFEHLTRVRPWLKPVPLIVSSTRQAVETTIDASKQRDATWNELTRKIVAAHMVGAEKGAR